MFNYELLNPAACATAAKFEVVLLLLEKALYEALLARVVIGGLLFATPTTLLIVPYATQGQRRQPAHGEFDEGLP